MMRMSLGIAASLIASIVGCGTSTGPTESSLAAGTEYCAKISTHDDFYFGTRCYSERGRADRQRFCGEDPSGGPVCGGIGALCYSNTTYNCFAGLVCELDKQELGNLLDGHCQFPK